MTVTRFSRIFSTILSLRALTGREEKSEDGKAGSVEELNEDVGDEGLILTKTPEDCSEITVERKTEEQENDGMNSFAVVVYFNLRLCHSNSLPGSRAPWTLSRAEVIRSINRIRSRVRESGERYVQIGRESIGWLTLIDLDSRFKISANWVELARQRIGPAILRENFGEWDVIFWVGQRIVCTCVPDNLAGKSVKWVEICLFIYFLIYFIYIVLYGVYGPGAGKSPEKYYLWKSSPTTTKTIHKPKLAREEDTAVAHIRSSNQGRSFCSSRPGTPPPWFLSLACRLPFRQVTWYSMSLSISIW